MAFALLGVAACSAVDHFSPRAVDYNIQAEQATQQVLLLNVVRASLRRPMQFTLLQSITGSTALSGAVTGGAADTRQKPVVSLFGITPGNTNPAISNIATGTAGGTVGLTGTATFTVPVLDTQEFYQGVLTPINLQIIDYYVQQGYPPEVLFDLFVSRIVVTKIGDRSCRKFTFENSVFSDVRFNQFQALLEYLLASGLTTERLESGKDVGPAIHISRAGGPGDAAKLVEAYSKATAAGLEIKGDRNSNVLRVRQRAGRFRFCFANSRGSLPRWLGANDAALLCGNPGPSSGFTRANEAHRCKMEDPEHEGSARTDPAGIRLAPEFLERIRRIQADEIAAKGTLGDDAFPVEEFANSVVTLEYLTRSTEGMIYYLGEILRRQQLSPALEEIDPPRVIQIKNRIRYGIYPAAECDRSAGEANSHRFDDVAYLDRARRRPENNTGLNCENLFRVVSDAPSDAIISVDYDGRQYSIPRDPALAGRSAQVIELIKQLFALNTSAKQLPATTVLSVINP